MISPELSEQLLARGVSPSHLFVGTTLEQANSAFQFSEQFSSSISYQAKVLEDLDRIWRHFFSQLAQLEDVVSRIHRIPETTKMIAQFHGLQCLYATRRDESLRHVKSKALEYWEKHRPKQEDTHGKTQEQKG